MEEFGDYSSSTNNGDHKPSANGAGSGLETSFVLRDSSTKSLSDLFTQIKARDDKRLEAIHETATLLHGVIEKFHESGISNVGIELMDFHLFKQHQIIPHSPPDNVMEFYLLSIYDTKFLVRVQPGGIVTLHDRNIERLHDPLYLNDIFQSESALLEYKLKQEQGKISLMEAIVSIAATRAATLGLKKHDLTARNASMISKSALSSSALGFNKK